MFESVFFSQGPDADEYLFMIEKKGPAYLLSYLNNAGALKLGQGQISEIPFYDDSDNVKKFPDGWIVSWNSKVNTVGVEYQHRDRDPETKYTKKNIDNQIDIEKNVHAPEQPKKLPIRKKEYFEIEGNNKILFNKFSKNSKYYYDKIINATKNKIKNVGEYRES